MKSYEYLLNRSVIVLVIDLTVDNFLRFQKQKQKLFYYFFGVRLKTIKIY